MPLDGIAISNIKYELESEVLNGRIDKIYQTEKDEIVLSVRSSGKTRKILLTASSSNPRIHFTALAKENPKTPPMFCMVLRKHLASGKILSIEQPDFERILILHVEAINDMGDLGVKKLIIEIMGKHSNIILVGEEGNIIDAITHVSYDKSSVRQVLPGKSYVNPPSQNKRDPLTLAADNFFHYCEINKTQKLQELIYKNYTGISPVIASEICIRAGLNPSDVVAQLDQEALSGLLKSFQLLVADIEQKTFKPAIIYDEKGKPIEFASVSLSLYEGYEKKGFESISELLEAFYAQKDAAYRTIQKTQDLRKLIQNHIDRLVKKKEIQLQTLKDIENRDLLKRYGELITANVYAIEKGMTEFTTVNYYEQDSPDIKIPLDSSLTPVENAQKYFKKYNKAKRTHTALKEQKTQNENELYYLDSLMIMLSGTLNDIEIAEIRQELYEEGYLKRSTKEKGKNKKLKNSKPMHFISRDGYDIYVGKNNKQNDELTLKFANGNDLWFHAKNMPGSHVIIKAKEGEIPTETMNEAAYLAAFYSKAKESSMVPVDFALKRYVKKPNGAKPGMVIYDQYNTAYVTPDSQLIDQMNKISD